MNIKGNKTMEEHEFILALVFVIALVLAVHLFGVADLTIAIAYLVG